MSLSVQNKMMFSIYDDSPEINGFPRHLLQSFLTSDIMPNNFHEISQGVKGKEKEEDQIELSLGLSLNGRFGVDPKRTKLSRSSSIPEFLNFGNYVAPEPQPPLVRTCSLPAKSGEELRKIQEILSMKRVKARAKWLEKMRKGKISRNRWEINKGDNSRRSLLAANGGQPGVVIEPARERNEGRNVPPQSPSRQGSSGSSGITEYGSPPKLDQFKKKKNDEKEMMMKKVLLEMPYVFTRGDGPRGERIDGFLYRYNKGEEASIVCVCHGSFLSPAEFVKHAGGKDVVYPLKHILVSPFPVM